MMASHDELMKMLGSLKDEIRGGRKESKMENMELKKDLKDSNDNLRKHLNELKDNLTKDLKEVKDSISKALARLDSVEAEQNRLKDRISSLEESSGVKVSKVVRDLNEARDKLQEDIERLRCSSNLILFNVEESEDGDKLASDLLSVILPNHAGGFPMIRIPPQRSPDSDPTSRRPLKVTLNNAGEKVIALRNCKLLKGLDQFRGISVKPDQTRKQRDITRSSIQTRSQKRNRQMEDEDNGGIITGKPSKSRKESEVVVVTADEEEAME